MSRQRGGALLVVILLIQLSAWILVQGFSDTLRRHQQSVLDLQLAHADRATESALAYAAWKLSRGDPVPSRYPYSNNLEVLLSTQPRSCGDEHDEDELLCWQIHATAKSSANTVSVERTRGFISEALCDSGWWSL